MSLFRCNFRGYCNKQKHFIGEKKKKKKKKKMLGVVLYLI